MLVTGAGRAAIPIGNKTVGERLADVGHLALAIEAGKNLEGYGLLVHLSYSRWFPLKSDEFARCRGSARGLGYFDDLPFIAAHVGQA